MNPTHRSPYSPYQLSFGTAVFALSGAMAGEICTSSTAFGGSVFGVTTYLSSRLINWICDQIGDYPDLPLYQIAKSVLSLFAGIAIGVQVVKMAGFSISFAAGVLLTAAAIGTAISTILVLGLCLCSSAITIGVIMAFKIENQNPSLRA
jgi:hypothetical protein